MRIDSAKGCAEEAHWKASPNCDARPHSLFINTLLIHAISLPPGKFGGEFVEALFCNELDVSCHPYFESISSLKVSAHFYLKRTGQIMQFVSTHDRAWHAGLSLFEGHDRVNDFSIGIELEGCDEAPFTDQQYSSLTSLTHALMLEYPAISQKRIIGHCHVAPGRKTDPGPHFDWPRYKNTL